MLTFEPMTDLFLHSCRLNVLSDFELPKDGESEQDTFFLPKGSHRVLEEINRFFLNANNYGEVPNTKEFLNLSLGYSNHGSACFCRLLLPELITSLWTFHLIAPRETESTPKDLLTTVREKKKKTKSHKSINFPNVDFRISVQWESVGKG